MLDIRTLVRSWRRTCQFAVLAALSPRPISSHASTAGGAAASRCAAVASLSGTAKVISVDKQALLTSCMFSASTNLSCRCIANVTSIQESRTSHHVSVNQNLLVWVHTHRESERKQESERTFDRGGGAPPNHHTRAMEDHTPSLSVFSISYQYESSILGKVSRLVVVWVI